MQIKYSYPNTAIKICPNHCKAESIFTGVAIGKEKNSSKKNKQYKKSIVIYSLKILLFLFFKYRINTSSSCGRE